MIEYCKTWQFRRDLIVMVIVWTVVITTLRAGGEVIVLETFDDDPVLEWSSSETSQTPSGEWFLGPFGVETVTLVITVPANSTVSRFHATVYAIGEWPEFDRWHPVFPVALHATYSVDGAADQALIDSDLMNHVRRIGTDTLGYDDPDRAYRFMEPLQSGSEHVLTFTGSQDGMVWGIDNVEVHAVAVPEPGTGTMLWIVGLSVFVAWCAWRIRVMGRDGHSGVRPGEAELLRDVRKQTIRWRKEREMRENSAKSGVKADEF